VQPRSNLAIVVKEIAVIGSRCGPFAKAIALLGTGRVDPRPLLTRAFPLSMRQLPSLSHKDLE